MDIYVAYTYIPIGGVDTLKIGMIGTNEEEVETFAEKNELDVDIVEDGEEFPAL